MAMPIVASTTASSREGGGSSTSTSGASYAAAKRFLGMVDHVFSQHRFCLFIYLAVFVKIWSLDFMKDPASRPESKTTEHCTQCDAETAVLPLSRYRTPSSVESSPEEPGKAPRKRRKVLVANVNDVKSTSDSGEQLLATKGNEEDAEATRILKRVLTNNDAPPIQDEELSEAYSALAHMHSARGQYAVAIDAMDRAVQVAVDGKDRAIAQAAFASLELKHYRYEAAAARFTDALAYGKSTMGPGLYATVLSGIGWAELMQRRMEEANAHFRAVLKETMIDVSRQELFTEAACRPRGHILDAIRAYAMAGLSMVLALQGVNTTNGSSPRPDAVAGCAANFLVGAGHNEHAFDGMCHVPLARRALGLAFLTLGQTQKARQQYTQALQMELDSSYAWPAVVTPANLVKISRSSRCDTGDLTRCSHHELNMMLVELQAGDRSAAQLHVDRMLKDASGFPGDEVSEWLARFSEAHAWLFGKNPGYAALLSGRRVVSPRLLSESATKDDEILPAK